jgi:hypothetical protein
MFLRSLIAIAAAAICVVVAGTGVVIAGSSGSSPSGVGASVDGVEAGASQLTRAERRRCAKKPTRRLRRRCRRRAAAPETPREPQLFAPSSFWNVRLRADAPIDPMSSAYVTRLQQLLKRWSPYVNTTHHSTPVYTVPRDEPTVRVTLDKADAGDLQAVWEDVPIPPKARPADGSDRHMVVWQPATDTMWEFWQADRRSDGWHAEYGGRMTNVSQSPGHYRAIKNSSGRHLEHQRWGATATSLPLLGGLMRIDELEAGRVDHALAIALPEIRAGEFSWPAQRTDGKSTHPSAIPEGARFRLDPNLDLSQIEMSPIVWTIAVAAQRYGIVVRDGAGSVTFFAEDPTPTGSNPFLGLNGLFGGDYISDQLRAFPWEHLQVLKTDMREDPDSQSGPGILTGG